jgi:site-specific recombinase XerD
MYEVIELVDIYNEEAKSNFLSKYEKPQTQKAFLRVFKNTAKMEEDLKKDLYLFTKEELEEFYEQTTPSTAISARNFGRMVNQYINWAVEDNRIDEHPFPVQQHYFLRYVKNYEDEFLTYKELRYYTHLYFKNLQDGVILELLFYGINGKESSELRNLTVDKINIDEKKITVYDDGTGKERDVYFEDNEVIKYCLDANKEENYEKRNGEMEHNPRIRPYSELIMDSPYVLKNSKTNIVHEGCTSKYTIHNRLKSIQKFAEIEPIKHKITVRNIVRSGQLYMASKLYERDGEFDLPQMREICKYFDVKTQWTMRDFLNVENIEKYYPHVVNKVKNKK